MTSRNLDGVTIYHHEISSIKHMKEKLHLQNIKGMTWLIAIALICAVVNLRTLEANGATTEFIEDAGTFIHIISN